MVVVPINAQINKAQNITQENRNQVFQGFKTIVFGCFYFQDHYGDDNGQYAIAKGFESTFVHGFIYLISKQAISEYSGVFIKSFIIKCREFMILAIKSVLVLPKRNQMIFGGKPLKFDKS